MLARATSSTAICSKVCSRCGQAIKCYQMPDGTIGFSCYNCGYYANHRILNLGCGTEKYGTHRVDMEQTQTTTHVFNVEDGILFPSEFFREVYEQNLLEHLQDHGYHLREVNRILVKGGRLVLVTDNASCLRFYLLRTHMGSYMGHRKFLSRNEDKHYAVFTQEHLRNLLTNAGFKIISMEYVDTDFKPTFFLDRVLRALHILPYLFYPRIRVVGVKL